MSTIVTSETPTPVDAPTTPAVPRTTLPVRPGGNVAPAQRRAIGGVSRDAVLVLVGAMASAVATTALVFGRLTPLSGKFGFVVEGRHPAFAMRDGVYVESWSMGRLHPAPPGLPAR